MKLIFSEILGVMVGALFLASCNQKSLSAKARSYDSGLLLTNTVSDPVLAEMCSFTGLEEGALNGICPVRKDDWLLASEIGIYEALDSTLNYYGLVPLPIKSCSLQKTEDWKGIDEPGWMLRVERKVSDSLAQHYTDHHEVKYQVSRIDLAEPCGLILAFTLKQHRVILSSQSKIKLRFRRIVIDPENEVYSDTVIRDIDGFLLIGESKGTRPEVWDKKLWPEVSLSISLEPACRLPAHPTTQILRFSLASGQEKCTLDGGRMRCCEIAGKPYKVFSDTAWRNDKNPQQRENVFVTVGRANILEYVAP